MSRPIKLTNAMLDNIKEEFVESIKRIKMFDGKVDFSKSFKFDGNDRVSVVFSSAAFAKMTLLVQTFPSEVAWHGVVKRDENNPSCFRITDILVYPQIVTGATVNTDQVPYQDWLYAFDDDIFNNIRMQGHSHVDFSTTPSSVDIDHQTKILSQVDDDMFYIFMIWNKKFEKSIKVFDMANNTLYETEDVDVYIGEDGVDLSAFIEGAKEVVKNKPAAQAYATTSYYDRYNTYQRNTCDKPEKVGASSVSKPSIGKSADSYDFGRDIFGSYNYYDKY